MVVGLDDKNRGAEYHMDEYDTWNIKIEKPELVKFFKVLEVFKKDDKKYYSVNAKEWHTSEELARKVYSSEKFFITKVLTESKPKEWIQGIDSIVLENSGYGDDGNQSKLGIEDEFDIIL